MENQKSRTNFFDKYKRLLKDENGNTIILIGAALIPLLAIIGGGVDASRGYMAKARLQQACDAATLAGRRAVGNGTFDLIAQQEADRLFSANFEQGFLGSTNTAFTTSSTNNGNSVEGLATTSVPTVIMRIFGNEFLNLNVTCQAALDIANADITMVLDTTGSMGFDIDGNSLDPTGNGRQVDGNGDPFPNSRILSLRTAAKNFFRVLDTAATQTSARIRYAFVPYSSTVNVGGVLLDNPAGSLITGQNAGESHTYNSRIPIFRVTESQNTTTEFLTVNGEQVYVSDMDCDNFGDNVNIRRVGNFNNNIEYFFRQGNNLVEGGSNPLTEVGDPVVSADGTTERRFARLGRIAPSFTPPGGGNNRARCRRTVTTTEFTETTDPNAPGAQFERWNYTEVSVPVSDYVGSLRSQNGVPVPSNYPQGATAPPGFDVSRHVGNFNPLVWEGCIEERETVAAAPNQISFNSGTGISPGGALDLNIDLAPSDEASRWHPYWPEITFRRVNDNFTGFSTNASTENGAQRVGTLNGQLVPLEGAGGIQACPQPSRTLSTLTETDFDDYIDTLRPSGATYHDIGALWGARISSPDGIFADIVNDPAPNNGFVSRNLIFLTDGVIEPRTFIYSAYGIEAQSPNVGAQGSTDGGLAARHNARFLAICEAVKAKGTRVFVIAFGTDLSPELQQCASVNSAFLAADSDDLNDTFLQIASNIADLRLTQ